MTTAPTSLGRRALAKVLPLHLTAAWLTVAVLYIVHATWLPSPFPAFLLSTLVGLAGSAVLVMTMHRAAKTTPEPRRPAAQVLTRTTGPITDLPVSTAPPPLPITGENRAPADRAGYPSAAQDERQCPRCGGFAVAVGTDGSARCRTCTHRWQADQPAIASVRSWLHQR